MNFQIYNFIKYKQKKNNKPHDWVLIKMWNYIHFLTFLDRNVGFSGWLVGSIISWLLEKAQCVKFTRTKLNSYNYLVALLYLPNK